MQVIWRIPTLNLTSLFQSWGAMSPYHQLQMGERLCGRGRGTGGRKAMWNQDKLGGGEVKASWPLCLLSVRSEGEEKGSKKRWEDMGGSMGQNETLKMGNSIGLRWLRARHWSQWHHSVLRPLVNYQTSLNLLFYTKRVKQHFLLEFEEWICTWRTSGNPPSHRRSYNYPHFQINKLKSRQVTYATQTTQVLSNTTGTYAHFACIQSQCS